MSLHIYDTAEDVATEFAKYLEQFIRQKNTSVYIALSGGSTPKLLFKHLAEQYHDKINWKNVHLFWGDERCVPSDHADSNYKMTFDNLLSHIIIPWQNVHRIIGENDPHEEAMRYSEEIKSIVPMVNGVPVFDIVMLGMGDDGHTLSIFPHEMHLFNSQEICVVATHPTSGQKRVSLSGNIANHAANIAFMVTGENKAERMREIIHKEGQWQKYPASHIKPANGRLMWYADKSAAKLL
ncbi:MAG: 6-phosphogluconolactonase [Cytophagaceae bacterium]|nr:6-phosphogluconolactonase [Cytophagaceae bacterium]MDW8457119.1 6-phosphogluconolactonase [Cytophagaceae bacterium]